MAPHPCVYGQHLLDLVGYQGTKDMRLGGGYVGRDGGRSEAEVGATCGHISLYKSIKLPPKYGEKEVN